LFIVFNLNSGHGDSAEVHDAIARSCVAAGRPYRIFAIDRPEHFGERIDEAVRSAEEAGGIVVAAGGDGTISAVAQATLGRRCAFGVLPQGTFNYFSRTHAIPSDTGEAMALLLRSTPQAVQVGMVNDRIFLVNASLGLYAKLLEDREAFKAQYGRSRAVAFLAGLVTLLSGFPLWDLRIVFRGQERLVRTPTLFVGNNALQLERMGLPEAEALDQGELAAIALRPIGRLAMLSLLAHGALGRLGDAEHVTRLSFRSLNVDAVRRRRATRIKVATDGEVVWMKMPLVFKVAPEPLWLMKPPPGEGLEARV
jgi:diacylglycerol kinase family enzyme